MKTTSFLAILIILMIGFFTYAEESSTVKQIYIFSSFRGNGEDGLHLAYSSDGIQWTALKNDKSFLKPGIGGKLMRDPCVIQGPDRMFHMTWTTSWADRGVGIAHSRDLIDWSEQKFVPVMEHEAHARNCWAPEIIWDDDNKQYVIYWATTIPDRFPETAQSADKGWNHRIYFTATKDFETYSETKLLYEPGFNVIDSTIIQTDDQYVMIMKDETRYPPAKDLHISYSTNITGPWSSASEPFTPQWVEGPTCVNVCGSWIVYYDEYTRHKYGAMKTKDFKNWENISDKIKLPAGTRHGTIFSVSNEVLIKLLEEK